MSASIDDSMQDAIPLQPLASTSSHASFTAQASTPANSDAQSAGSQATSVQHAIDVDLSTLESQIAHAANHGDGDVDGNDALHDGPSAGTTASGWALVERFLSVSGWMIAVALFMFSLVSDQKDERRTRWTALKDFREDCRATAASNQTLSTACQDALAETLSPPPFVRSEDALTGSSDQQGPIPLHDFQESPLWESGSQFFSFWMLRRALEQLLVFDGFGTFSGVLMTDHFAGHSGLESTLHGPIITFAGFFLPTYIEVCSRTGTTRTVDMTSCATILFWTLTLCMVYMQAGITETFKRIRRMGLWFGVIVLVASLDSPSGEPKTASFLLVGSGVAVFAVINFCLAIASILRKVGRKLKLA